MLPIQMEISPYGTVDISPRLIGAMNLFLTSSGTCDVSEYSCGSTWGRSLLQGNYSNINLSIGPFTCIQATNMMPYSIHIDYAWHADINAMVMLLLFWIMCISTCCTCMTAICGRWIIPLVRHVWKAVAKHKAPTVQSMMPSAPPSMYSTMITTSNDSGNSGEPLRHQQQI